MIAGMLRVAERIRRRLIGGKAARAVAALAIGLGLAIIGSALSGKLFAPSDAPAGTFGSHDSGGRQPARSPGWKYIIVHHSATKSGNAEIFGEHHRKVRGWNSLGYHFVIGNGKGSPDGAVEVGERWLRQEVGAHAGSPEYNARGIGICLVGNFEEDYPTQAQLAAATALCAELCDRYGIDSERILGHRDVKSGGDTLCPGRNFPIKEFVEKVSRLKGRSGFLSFLRTCSVAE